MNWGITYMDVVLTTGVCFMLWLTGSYFIWKKSSKSQGVRRSLFLLLALIGLALVITKPQYKIELESEVAHINTSNEAIDVSASENTFDDVHSFLRSDIVRSTSELHIHGLGLEREELDLLEGRKMIYHPSDLISGITVLRVPPMTERERSAITGSFQGADVERVYLIGPDESIHEGQITESDFQINMVAPLAGSYLLEIHTILTSTDTVKEWLPIEVGHEPMWQMLVLSSYPSFEINYLKNYWTSLGNGFALRSKISKEKFHASFTNAPKVNLDVLTRKTIGRYDFIITDSQTWNALSSSEQSYVKRAVINEGLALVIRPINTEVITNNLMLPKWGEGKEIKWKTATDDVVLNGYDIPSSWQGTSLQGHVVARSRASGLGHIAVLGIDNTYKLILADNQKYYQNLWSAIFSDLYRGFSPTPRLLHNQWIWEGEKNTINILSNQDIGSPPLLNNSLQLPYLQVPYLSGVTDVSLWPRQGYNRINLQDDKAALKFYAHQRDSWRALKQAQLAPINRQAATASAMLSIAPLEELKPFSLFWWYGLCLLGFGALWLDERLYG